MRTEALVELLSRQILELKKDAPVIVGSDGVDAAGKTKLADALAEKVKRSGRDIIRASIDGFHHPREIRYRRGPDSPDGYYLDSFDYDALREVLLEPLSSGSLRYMTSIFNYRTDSRTASVWKKAGNTSILIMEGVFLFRPEIAGFFDLKVFIHADFDTVLERALKRAGERQYIGSEEDIIARYQKRYIPGQELYLNSVNPTKLADIVIDNNDFHNPVVVRKC